MNLFDFRPKDGRPGLPVYHSAAEMEFRNLTTGESVRLSTRHPSSAVTMNLSMLRVGDEYEVVTPDGTLQGHGDAGRSLYLDGYLIAERVTYPPRPDPSTVREIREMSFSEDSYDQAESNILMGRLQPILAREYRQHPDMTDDETVAFLVSQRSLSPLSLAHLNRMLALEPLFVYCRFLSQFPPSAREQD